MHEPATKPTFTYDERAAKYVTQLLLSAGDDEVMLDCSTGPTPDENGRVVIPVHTRLAMPWSTARQLKQLLDQLFQAEQQRAQSKPIVAPTPTSDRIAQLPTFDNRG